MALTDQLTSFTKKYFLPVVVDNIYASNAMFVRLRSKAEPLDGGRQITQQVIYAQPTSVGTYRGMDTLDIAVSEEFTEANFDWAQYYASIVLDGRSDRINSGKTAVVNLLKAKMQNAEKSLKDLMGTHVLGSGTDTNGIVGLQAMIDDGTNTATYGSIDRTTYTWWKAKYAANSGTGRQLTKYLMQNMFGQCTIDNDRPTMLITSQLVFDKYYLMVDPQQRFGEESLAKAGFQNLLFNGRPIVVDSHVATPNSNHQIFFLNENYVTLRYHQDCNFIFVPFQRPINQDAIVGKILWQGQMTSGACRMHGRLIDINPAL